MHCVPTSCSQEKSDLEAIKKTTNTQIKMMTEDQWQTELGFISTSVNASHVVYFFSTDRSALILCVVAPFTTELIWKPSRKNTHELRNDKKIGKKWGQVWTRLMTRPSVDTCPVLFDTPRPQVEWLSWCIKALPEGNIDSDASVHHSNCLGVDWHARL